MSVVLLVVLVVTGSALSASEPRSLVDPMDPDSVALAQLEDAASASRGDLALTQRLAATYLKRGQPGLAISAVRAAPAEVARDPMLTHRLAQAYEASGRVLDALGTAELALARCACAAGEQDGDCRAGKARCSASRMAAFEMHAEALAMLVRWGVTDPRHDTRTALAYRLAGRTVRIASLGLIAD